MPREETIRVDAYRRQRCRCHALRPRRDADRSDRCGRESRGHLGQVEGLEGYRHTRHGLTARARVEKLIEPTRHSEALERITRPKIEDTASICLKDGVAELLASLPSGAGPSPLPAPIIRRRADGRRGPEAPAGMVTATMIAQGKLAPDGFLVGAIGLGRGMGRYLVVEDTPAAVAAGTRNPAVAGTYPADGVSADTAVGSLARVAATVLANGTVRISPGT